MAQTNSALALSRMQPARLRAKAGVRFFQAFERTVSGLMLSTIAHVANQPVRAVPVGALQLARP